MGKKKKNKTVNAMMYAHQKPKKWAELKERYGVSGAQGGKPDNYGPGSERRDEQDVYNDIMRAAQNDYDTRRSLEAAGLTGDSKLDRKAAKLSGGGFNSIHDVAKAQNVLAKLKKRHVGGGGMGGAENIMGLTSALVNRDRDVFNESIDNRIAAQTKAEEFQQVQRDEGAPPDYEYSADLAAARGTIDAFDDFVGGGGMADMLSGNAQGAADAYRQQKADNIKQYLKPNPVSQRGEGLTVEGLFKI